MRFLPPKKNKELSKSFQLLEIPTIRCLVYTFRIKVSLFLSMSDPSKRKERWALIVIYI